MSTTTMSMCPFGCNSGSTGMRYWILSMVVISLCSFSSDSFQIMHHHYHHHRRHHHSSRESKISLMMSSINSNNNDEEQGINAIRSLAGYHQGEWKGRARSFTVTQDIAAGIVRRKTSPEYNVCVKLATDNTSGGAVTLSEVISWDDKISHRSIPLLTCDVDDVDASYSLDSNPADFPTVLAGTNKVCQFVVEHCIAAGEDRRCRCFAIYGVDDALIRVVVADEHRVNKGENDNGDANTSTIEEEKNSILTAQDLMEMESDIDRLVDKIAASMNTELPTAASSNVSPQLEENADSGVGDNHNDNVSSNVSNSRLDQLGESMTAFEKKNDEDTQKLSPHPINLLELVGGVWLGDMIIRKTPNVLASPIENQNKGFDRSALSKSSSSSSSFSKSQRNFADWNVGVQKVAWRYLWNFGDEIRQSFDFGKALGTLMDESTIKSLAGSVCVDESLSRRVPKDERMVYIDWAQQDSVGFFLGPYSVQVPRYVNFDPTATTSRTSAVTKPFYTEFSVFQGATPTTDQCSDGIPLTEKDLCCSKISRLYNFEGKLKQGCTSFYTFKRFEVEDDDDDNDDDDDQEI
jgi:hypothetical protein